MSRRDGGEEEKGNNDTLSFYVGRAVKKFFSSRLIMNSRRLWNSHQRHKFLSAEASRDILKFRVSEIASPGVFNRYFPTDASQFYSMVLIFF